MRNQLFVTRGQIIVPKALKINNRRRVQQKNDRVKEWLSVSDHYCHVEQSKTIYDLQCK